MARFNKSPRVRTLDDQTRIVALQIFIVQTICRYSAGDRLFRSTGVVRSRLYQG